MGLEIVYICEVNLAIKHNKLLDIIDALFYTILNISMLLT